MSHRGAILCAVQILILISRLAWAQADPSPPLYAPGEILLKLDPRLDGEKVAIGPSGVVTGIVSVDRLHRRFDVSRMDRVLFPRRRKIDDLRGGQWTDELARIFRLKIGPGRDVLEAVRAYSDDPHVVYAQPNYLNQLCVVPNDSLYFQQWALSKMRMPAAWDIERGSADVVVGMVDSGIDYDHQDLVGNVWINPGEDLNGNGLADSSDVNGIDDDDNGYVDDIRGWDFTDSPNFAGLGDYLERDNDPDDDLGHGTHVSGIVAALGDNGIGVAGITWHCRLMALRAAFRMSLGAFLEDDDVSAAIIYAADNGAQVINMSWGDPRISPVVRDVIAYAYARGCVLVAAAGNVDQEGIFYPGGFDQTIAVGASTSYDQRASFSSFGRNLDVLAPGSDILSTLPDDQYGSLGGTSMATAHVSGLAALLLSKDPALSAEQVRQFIAASAVDLGPAGYDPEHGSGRIDGLRALSVETATVARICQPETGTGVDSVATIVGTALGAYVDCYRLDYGLGLSPVDYHPILESTCSQALEETLFVWRDVAQLPDTTCAIRLRVQQTDGRVVEDRVVIHIDHTAPVIDGMRTVRRLDGEDYAPFVEWETDDETWARFYYRPQTEVDFSFVEGAHQSRIHSLDLSSELEPGEYQFYLTSTNTAGLTTVEDDAGQYHTLSLPFEVVERGGFLLLDELEPGYLFHRPVDLDRDGRREILFMSFSNTSAYGQVVAYEMSDDGRLVKAFESQAEYLVWDVGDADGDGRMEILGGGYAQIFLFESPDSASYPDPLNPVWSQEGVWGSQLVDTDGDGQMEILSKVEVGSDMIIFENTGDDEFIQKASLPNPTEGRNSTSTRFAVGDFDGDGRTEILAGDSDGDLYIYEATGNDQYQHTWTDSTGLEDARYLASGDSLTGGGSWFAVASNWTDVFTPRSTFWRLSVYHPTGDNRYQSVWSQELAGVGDQGNGIVAADFTGDGRKEIAFCALPDLYVFGQTEDSGFQPIWYTPCGFMYQPFVGDLQGDGLVEIAFNASDALVVLERGDPGETPPPPSGLTARPLDRDRVSLEWTPVPQAVSYNLYRGPDYYQLYLQQEGLVATAHLDSGLVAESIYWYAVTSVDSLSRESRFYSPVVSAMPNDPPRLVDAEVITERHIGVTFNEPMGPSAQVASHYWIDVQMSSPSSVILDRGGQRAVLGLPKALEPDVLHTVEVREVSDVTGVPIDPEAHSAVFSMPADTLPEPLLIRRVELLDRSSLDVHFSDPLQQSSAEDASHYSIVPALEVKEARLDSSDGAMIHLELSPVQALGMVHVLTVSDIWSQTLDKTIIPGLGDAASFVYGTTSLKEAIPVPNPFRPEEDQSLTFLNLPSGASARIFSLSGELVWEQEITEMQGGIQWMGTNAAGEDAASGVYLYVLEADGQFKKGKLVLLR